MSSQSEQKSCENRLDELENLGNWLQLAGQFVITLVDSERLQLSKCNRQDQKQNSQIQQMEQNLHQLQHQLEHLKNQGG